MLESIQSPNDLLKEIQDAKISLARLKGDRDSLLRRKVSADSEIETYKKEQLELLKAKAVLDDLVKSFIGFQLDRIKQYVGFGLKTVIPDQDLDFECEITTKMNKPWVEFLTVNADGISANALEGFGGSVAQIESLILRVLAILQLKLYPLIILDESLNAVSEEYLPNLSYLLRELSKQLGVKILLVTHNKEILHSATRIYKASERHGSLHIEEVQDR
jgi:hypothetical protein